ncbi:hypothetical protein Mth01_11180 [Sphaerimonospora thailandensis]|uniref:Multicopper oxidase n=2 Tax=Sphaerimonospora thailandensis TaxID=795644 RepID=A0A8J3R6R9_9ACTN|nr:hypothetical protein Mth01_11180 [Sphaerimonospora thailandensis]
MKFDVPGPVASIPDSGTKLPATYIHHCHILEHEDNDNDKMRQWALVAPHTRIPPPKVSASIDQDS